MVFLWRYGKEKMEKRKLVRCTEGGGDEDLRGWGFSAVAVQFNNIWA